MTIQNSVFYVGGSKGGVGHRHAQLHRHLSGGLPAQQGSQRPAGGYGHRQS